MAEDDFAERIENSGMDKDRKDVAIRAQKTLNNIMYRFQRFEKRFPSIFILILLMYVSGCLYFFFRHSPNVPDMRYPEFFISLVYIANMFTIYSIVFDFFCLTTLSSCSIILTLIPLKQMSGYSWWRTILKYSVASLIMFLLLVGLIVLSIMCVGMYVRWHV